MAAGNVTVTLGTAMAEGMNCWRSSARSGSSPTARIASSAFASSASQVRSCANASTPTMTRQAL